MDFTISTKFQKGKIIWLGFHKHGTASNGLIITSTFKNYLYIMPEDKVLFLQNVLEINPEVIEEMVLE